MNKQRTMNYYQDEQAIREIIEEVDLRGVTGRMDTKPLPKIVEADPVKTVVVLPADMERAMEDLGLESKTSTPEGREREYGYTNGDRSTWVYAKEPDNTMGLMKISSAEENYKQLEAKFGKQVADKYATTLEHSPYNNMVHPKSGKTYRQ